MRPISQIIDPHAQRAAIDALEAQRAAYRRFARQAEAQRVPLSDGDVEQVAAFTDGAAAGVDALHQGAHRVRALVDSASAQASAPDLRELERRMDDMMREARTAEVAIRNLTSQLEAWRDAYGRQLAESGLTPGASGDSTSDTPLPRGYGHHDVVAPRILDRKG